MITNRFEHEGHKEYFVCTIVAYVSSLHDVLYLWHIRVVTGDVSDLSAFSIDRLYPLSSHQHAILADITGALTSRRDVQDNCTPHNDEQSSSWRMYRVLLGNSSRHRERNVCPCRCPGGPAGSGLPQDLPLRHRDGYFTRCLQHPHGRSFCRRRELRPEQIRPRGCR